MARFKTPSDITVGVVGYGGRFNMGKQHLSEMKRAGMRPIAVCELDAERRAVAESDFPGIETYASLDTMLKRSAVSLIVHITPHKFHYPLAAKCVRAGKHVVTEKPFVLNTSQADRLIALAKKHKVMVSTYHNRHWDGWILRAKREVVDKKILGEVVRVEAHMGGYHKPGPQWRNSKSISGGVLYDWGVHLIEYALQVIPGKIETVTGFAHTGHWAGQQPKGYPWKNDANEDYAAAIVRFSSGAFLNLSVGSINAQPRDHQIAIHGTKGCYLISIGSKGWVTRIANRKNEIVEKAGKHPQSKGQLFYKNIAAYLCGKSDLVITPEYARRPIHILDLADRSAKSGRTLKAKYG